MEQTKKESNTKRAYAGFVETVAPFGFTNEMDEEEGLPSPYLFRFGLYEDWRINVHSLWDGDPEGTCRFIHVCKFYKNPFATGNTNGFDNTPNVYRMVELFRGNIDLTDTVFVENLIKAVFTNFNSH